MEEVEGDVGLPEGDFFWEHPKDYQRYLREITADDAADLAHRQGGVVGFFTEGADGRLVSNIVPKRTTISETRAILLASFNKQSPKGRFYGRNRISP